MKIAFVVAAATSLMLAGTACSSSTTNGAGAGAGAKTTKPAAGSTAALTSAAPASSAAAPTGGGGTDSNSWCGEIASSGEAIISADDPSALPPNWQAKAEKLAADAPSEIRSDVETLVKGDEKIISGDATADQTPAFLQAGQHVVAWLEAHCPSVMASLNPGLGSPTG